MTKKVKNTVPWTYELWDINGEEIVGTFYEKELNMTNQSLKVEEVIKRKRDKLYTKWKGYDNSFNIRIDKIILFSEPYTRSKTK